MRSARSAYIEDREWKARTASDTTLTPAQQKAADDVLAGMAAADVCLLRASAGMGKTTVLRKLHRNLGGAFVIAQEFMTLLKKRSPAAIEETFMEVLQRAIEQSDMVIVDDLHLVTEVVQGYDYPRANLINAAMSVVLTHAESRNKKFLFAVNGENEPAPVRHRALSWEMDGFEPEDFAAICRHYLGDAAERLDFSRIHLFAPALSAYQLKNACLWLGLRHDVPDTEAFIDYLRSRNLTSNVDIDEVEPVGWNDLKGVDDVIEELEAKIALPFENDPLTAELQLKPKRGVLLAGPPGTGKTTIGRALAHRLRGKFFLIDGRVNAPGSNFYDRVSDIFRSRQAQCTVRYFHRRCRHNLRSRQSRAISLSADHNGWP